MPSWQSRIITIIFKVRRMLNPPTGVLVIEKEREETESLAALFKTRDDVDCTPVEVGNIPAEWITPPDTSNGGVILYFHGGSYNSGSLVSHRSLVANIGVSTKSRLLNLEYRLAPEHPFPAAVDDAVTAYQWLLDNKISPNKILIAGDSAGGGLAIALPLKLRDIGVPLPAGMICLSPWTDLTCSGESWMENQKIDFMLNLESTRESAKVYLNGADPRAPLASPRYADLNGLPPILLQVGTDELILSDSTSFAEAARKAGVDVTLEIWDGMQHEWHFAARYLPEGRDALEHIGEFVEKDVYQT